MNIAIAGTGYVGLVTAAVLANAGHDVTCVDIDAEKVKKLNDGICPIYEPGLEELIQNNKERMHFTVEAASAYAKAECIFVAVGTPEKNDGSANLKYVFEVVDEILESVETDPVVVIKSTVPIGTNDKIQQYAEKKAAGKHNIQIVSNPEFLSQGTAVHDMLHASRIIIGVEDESARKRMEKVYEAFDCPKLFTNRCSAEMIKYASNDFLALKISYINEIANLCEVLGADVSDVSKGMGMDPRIGDKFLNAGIGYGGSCFPKDTKALHWLSNYYEKEMKTVKAAVEVNANQKIKLLKKAHKYFADFAGLKVAVLGLAFKAGTDDLRESPALDIIPVLLEDGAAVRAFDPVAEDNFKKRFPGEGIEYFKTPAEAVKGADICMIITDWPEIKALSWDDLSGMNTPVILDGRNCFDPSDMEKHKLVYDPIGRRCINNLEL